MVMHWSYVSDILRFVQMNTKVCTPFACGSMTELFSKDNEVQSWKKGEVIFVAGGTGHPYFSTDTATALRAIELDTDVILMAKAVDGVYDSDPKTNPESIKYEKVTYQVVMDKKLAVMDMTYTVMCMANNQKLLVFSLTEYNSIVNNEKGLCTGPTVPV